MVISLSLNGRCVALKFIIYILLRRNFFRSFWKDESYVTAEINRLREDLIKAEKDLDHAMPGV